MSVQENIKSTLSNVNMGNKRTHTIEVDFSDVEESFVGKIVVHYPSQIEKMQIGVTKANFLGGVEVDVTTNNIAHILATLNTVVDHKPDWFSPDDPRIDYSMLEEVYMEYIKWHDTFRRKSK